MLRLWCLMPLSTIFQLYCGASFIIGGNRRKPPTCRKYLTNLYHMMLYRVHLDWVGFELTTLVVIGSDCINSCKSNYHAITTTTIPYDKHKFNNTHLSSFFSQMSVDCACIELVPRLLYTWQLVSLMNLLNYIHAISICCSEVTLTYTLTLENYFA